MKRLNKFNIEEWAPKEAVDDSKSNRKKKAVVRNLESEHLDEEEMLALKILEEEQKLKEREAAAKE
jgi:hypothetical protein